VGKNRGSQTGGQEAKIKNYSHDDLLKETEQWAKGSPSKKAPRFTKKGKTLTLCSNLELAVGDDVVVDEDVDG
jgi:hypothetical protein